MSFTAIILTGGDLVSPSLRSRLPPADLVIAADSGFELAQLLGLKVDLVIGDFDSLDPRSDLASSEVERHPADKDSSDLELAFAAANARGSSEIVVVGGGGGRLDHLLANAAVIAGHDEAEITWLTGQETTYVVRDTRSVDGLSGDLVTLLALGGDVHGVTTTGLQWSLVNEDLPFGSGRGLSNLMKGTRAQVSVSSGTLLVIHTSTQRIEGA